MLGYSVDFSIIYAIMTTQSGESALDKRIGKYIIFIKKKKAHNGEQDTLLVHYFYKKTMNFVLC
jgi:hypothetical protein